MKNLLFLTVAFAAILVACSKEKSEDLIEPMTKSGEVTTFAPGKQELACKYYVWTVHVGPGGIPYYSNDEYSGKMCGSGQSGCRYTDVCSPFK